MCRLRSGGGLSINSGCDILVVTLAFFGRGMVLCDRFDIDLDVVAEEDDKESDEKSLIP